MERQTLYDHLQSLTWQQQLGHLASTSATISSQSTVSQQDDITRYLLRESALIIEWSAPNVPVEYHQELAYWQKEIMAWYQVFPIEKSRHLLSLQSRYKADRLVEISHDLSTEINRIKKESIFA